MSVLSYKHFASRLRVPSRLSEKQMSRLVSTPTNIPPTWGIQIHSRTLPKEAIICGTFSVQSMLITVPLFDNRASSL